MLFKTGGGREMCLPNLAFILVCVSVKPQRWMAAILDIV